VRASRRPLDLRHSRLGGELPLGRPVGHRCYAGGLLIERTPIERQPAANGWRHRRDARRGQRSATMALSDERGSPDPTHVTTIPRQR